MEEHRLQNKKIKLEEIESISATKIRAKLRKVGKLNNEYFI